MIIDKIIIGLLTAIMLILSDQITDQIDTSIFTTIILVFVGYLSGVPLYERFIIKKEQTVKLQGNSILNDDKNLMEDKNQNDINTNTGKKPI